MENTLFLGESILGLLAELPSSAYACLLGVDMCITLLNFSLDLLMELLDFFYPLGSIHARLLI